MNIFAHANLLCFVLAKISAARVWAGVNLGQSVIQESHPSGRVRRRRADQDDRGHRQNASLLTDCLAETGLSESPAVVCDYMRHSSTQRQIEDLAGLRRFALGSYPPVSD